MSRRINIKSLLPDLRMELTSLIEDRMTIISTNNSRMQTRSLIPRAENPPVNTVPPVALPTTVYVGSLATVDNGTWTGTSPIYYTYQWYRDNGMLFPELIPGAVQNYYSVKLDDVGYTLYAMVTATNIDGSASISSSDTSAVILPTLPVNTVAPVASGIVGIGNTLSCTTGTWTGIPAPTFTYQWTIDGAYIAFANASTYVVQAGQELGEFKCIVFALNVAGLVSQESNVVIGVEAPVNTVAPVATGTVRIGNTLTSTDGTWTGTPTPTFTYQWFRNGVTSIGGATASTYVVTGADMESTLTCRVTATNIGGAVNASSNGLESPWKAALIQSTSKLIFDGLDPNCYGNVSIGSPVTNIYSVNGTFIGTQATSGSRPTRGTASLVFDGLDDYFVADTHASKFNAACTAVFGFRDPNDVSTAARTLFCLGQADSGSTTRQLRMNYARPGAVNLTRMSMFIADTTGVTISLIPLGVKGAGPYNLDFRFGAPGASCQVDDMTSPLTIVDSAVTRPNNETPSYTILAIGARSIGITPTVSQYWEGKVTHFLLDSFKYSEPQTLVYRTAAIAAGVMV